MAKSIKTRIDEANDYAKLINNRESLVELEDQTDYTSIPQMAKDYKPYYDLWTTVETWRNSHHSWLHDPLEEIDSESVENLVETANKTMAQVLRFFRDKDLPGISKIADDIK
jgi:dynein heavy chain, axonemal